MNRREHGTSAARSQMSKKQFMRILEHWRSGYSSVVVQMLNDAPLELKGWGRLHVGAEKEVRSEHIELLVTNLIQRHRE